MNKGADQVRDYRAAELCLSFHVCKKQFSHDAAHLRRAMVKKLYFYREVSKKKD